MNDTQDAVTAHYRADGMRGRIEAALRHVGLEDGPIPWQRLAALDQFHARGLPATQELAAGLGLTAGQSVLDVGSGLGGPARYLAAAFGARVTGIELTPEYVAVADWLTERTGLADRVRFVTGDALALPFPDASFDHAWTQHVAMNIADKAGLYAAVYRVLRSGGRFAIYDVVRGATEPVLYPVPWARDATLSFLVSADEMTDLLRAAGFRLVSSADTTDIGLSALSAQLSAPPDPLSLPNALGADFGPAVANFARNLAEGCMRLAQVVAEKAGV